MENFVQVHRVMGPIPTEDPHRGMAVICLFVFVVLASVGMYLVYRIFSESNWAYHAQDPIEIAEERFAKGEITKTQLHEIRKELE